MKSVVVTELACHGTMHRIFVLSGLKQHLDGLVMQGPFYW